MATTFKQLPIDLLISTWRGKLPSNVAEPYIQMARIIAERDLNLAALFSELMVSAVPITPSNDSYSVSNLTTLRTYDAASVSLDELARVLGSLIDSLQGTGIIQ